MQNYINQIYNRLKAISPYKIILYGSFAYGKPKADSDIDIIVVTNDMFYPNNYREHMDIYLKVSHLLTDIIQNQPIDLIVYTRPMYDKFVELDSMFSREIQQKGKIIYEKDSKGMVE
jgi:predicted nucleotidyltransferase